MITARVASSNFPVDLGVEAETGEAALHVAALTPVEADLVFGHLVGFIGEGRRVDTRGQIAGRVRRTVLQRGDAGQRQRLEGAVRIVGEVGVEFFGLVGILDRAPELELDFGSGTGDDGGAFGASTVLPAAAGPD